MKVLRYDIRDVFLAAGLGLRLRKWLVSLPVVALGTIWWSFFGYLALLAQGLSPTLIWKTYGPMPWPSLNVVNGPISILLWLLAFVGAIAAWLLSVVAVSRITYKQLKGDDFYSWGAAWSFAFKKRKAVFLPPLFFVVAVGIVLLLLFAIARLVGLWGPFVGLLFPLVVVGAITILYLSMVGVQAFIMGPSIVAASSNETLEGLFELLSLHASQGKRCWLYSFTGGVISLVYSTVLGVFLAMGALLATWIMDMGHAGLAGRAIRVAAGLAPRLWSGINGTPGVVDSLLHQIGVSSAPGQMMYSGALPPASTGSILIGVWIAVMVFLLLAQNVTTFATCQTASYLVLRWMKDEQNLLEEDFEE